MNRTEAAALAETARTHLDRINPNLAALGAQLHALTDWTNSQGMVTESATLYKMKADIDYLRDIAPRIITSISR
jgi:hypothetical protein